MTMAKIKCVNNQFEIDYAKPLEEFSNSLVEAYEAVSVTDTVTPYYAAICKTNAPPRFDNFEPLQKIKGSVVKPIAFDFVHSSTGTEKKPVFLFMRPQGGRVFQFDKAFDEYELMNHFIIPLSQVIEEYHDRRITHRSIRPQQLYYVDSSKEKIILGESISSPAAALQPSLFEPIANMATHSLSRPVGTVSDDLYALGMLIAVLYHPNNPIIKMSKDDVIREKIEKTSYWLVAEKLSYSSRFGLLLNGLLADDFKQRWDINKLKMWIQGDKIAHVVNTKQKKNRKPIEFQGKLYSNYRSLACAFGQKPREASQFIRDKKLENWLSGMGEFDLAKRVGQITTQESGNVSSIKEYVLAAKISLLLFPEGATFFSNIAFDLEHLGSLVQAEYEQQPIRKFIHDLFLSDIARQSVMAKSFGGAVKTKSIDLIDNMKQYLSNKKPGMGIERCLYELAPFCPCHYAPIKNEYIFQLPQLILRLEEIAKSDQKVISLPMDRHLMAFIAARAPKDIKVPIQKYFGSNEVSNNILSLLKIFDFLQKEKKNVKMPHLTKQFTAYTKPLAQMFHSKKRRENKMKDLEKSCKSGLFSTILTEIEKNQSIQLDYKEFLAARKKFYENSEKVNKMRSKVRENFRINSGRYVASVFSLLVGLTGFFSILFMG